MREEAWITKPMLLHERSATDEAVAIPEEDLHLVLERS
jgi:hypothetical protein